MVALSENKTLKNFHACMLCSTQTIFCSFIFHVKPCMFFIKLDTFHMYGTHTHSKIISDSTRKWTYIYMFRQCPKLNRLNIPLGTYSRTFFMQIKFMHLHKYMHNEHVIMYSCVGYIKLQLLKYVWDTEAWCSLPKNKFIIVTNRIIIINSQQYSHILYITLWICIKT